MLKKLTVLVIILLFSIVSLPACGPKESTATKIGDVEIEFIEPNALKNKELEKWYEQYYQERFSHSVSFVDGYRYVLICAGQMPTEGYHIELTDAQRENGTLQFYAKLVSPAKDAKLAEVITYPHILFRVKETKETPVRAELDMGGLVADEASRDKCTGIEGIYIGQADNNFIEIEVERENNFPGNDNPVVFKLSDRVIGHFLHGEPEFKDFKENERVVFDCIATQEGQWEITAIDRVQK